MTNFQTKDSGKRKEYASAEDWSVVQEFPSYEVSSLGRVRRINLKTRAPKVLKTKTHKQGYQEITLCDFSKTPTKRYTRLVHRLVAKAFLPGEKEEVNHLNGDKADNRVENLAWSSPAENMQHAYESGLMGGLDVDDIIQIRWLKENTTLFNRQIGRLWGVRTHTVTQIVNEDKWQWTAHSL